MAIGQIVVRRNERTVDEGTMGFHDYVTHKEEFSNFTDRVSVFANLLENKKVINISYPSEDIAVIAYESEVE